MFRRNILMIAAVLGGLFVPAVANAASISAITTADLNIRTGPSVNYNRFATIPYGDNVRVNGCLSGYNWCDVSWAGTRGWVSGNYLAYLGKRYYRRSIPSIATVIGLPVVRYDYDDYYGRYYRGHVFRGHRFQRRHHKQVIHHERREHRREIRHDRREHKQDVRQDRRERRHENRQDRKKEVHQDRREHRRDARHERKKEVRHDRKKEVHQDRREHRRDGRHERRQERRGH